MTVFFVDDDEEVSSYYRRALEMRGCLVIFCSTVEQALKTSAENRFRFDVIVIDMMLPWGSYSEAATAGGLQTGLLLYNDLSKRHQEAITIVLTNYHENQIPVEFGNARIRICNKGVNPPRKFAELVLKLANRGMR